MGAPPEGGARLDENRIPAQAALPGRASPASSATRERRMPLPDQKTPFDKWKDTIDTSDKNPAWHSYDAVIKSTVDKYNAHLKSAPGFTALDWRLIKAMVWTESGDPAKLGWKTRPMQIGNPTDPGLAALLGGKEGGELIMPSDIASGLTLQNVRTDPVKNIQAGVGYLLMKAANFKYGDVWNPKALITEYTVAAGDSIDRIAKRTGSTVGHLYWLNPGLQSEMDQHKPLKIGRALKVQKATNTKMITGFKSLDNATVAGLYNTGDSRYAEKLAYCLGKIK
jgi:LysM repeat protein